VCYLPVLIQAASAEEYPALLTSERITLGLEQRREDIWQGVVAAAAAAGGVVPENTRGDLLEEVSNLVESPTVVAGAFAADFLALPK